MSIHYEIQGFRNGKWVTLFGPWVTLFGPYKADLYAAKLRDLRKTNPACKYRVRWVNDVTPDNSAIVEIKPD
jgi:SPX domain protein involved in polyphosphate accumulation